MVSPGSLSRPRAQVPSSALLDRARSQRPDDARLALDAVELAAALLTDANQRQSRGERHQAVLLSRMMADPFGKTFTLALADRLFRPPDAARAAAVYRHLLDTWGAPRCFPAWQRLALRAAALGSLLFPSLVMCAVTSRIRANSRRVVLPAEDRLLRRRLERRSAEGMRLNLNLLGEAVLGEDEAQRRLEANRELLADPHCDYVSVKVSSIFSQIHLVAFEETLLRIKERLRPLYAAAIEHGVRDPQGASVPKFVNLDMEEYRDLHLTCRAFREVLDEPRFLGLSAGIVLQAYLPDAWTMQRKLTDWARDRVARGGAPVKLRIVKGANLAMETVEAALHGWSLAPYASKEEVDANFKRMLHFGCRPENAAAVCLGVATHNLFDAAYALLLRAREGVEKWVELEMLEGMANHQARSVRDAAGDLLLYAPIVHRASFDNAIAYLIRRLDENTAPQNFLRDLFNLAPGDENWQKQKLRFLTACRDRDSVAASPRRIQDRAAEHPSPIPPGRVFTNEPITDWSLPSNVRWIRSVVSGFAPSTPDPIPLQIGGVFETTSHCAASSDPSRPGVQAYRHAFAGLHEVDRALHSAEKAGRSWARTSPFTRAEILQKAAACIAAARGQILATMVLDAGKAVSEGDPEVSEAIDFARYYACQILDPSSSDGLVSEPLGTVVVAPPWNFPFSIPCGGVVAALAAGNAVILKPAPDTVLTAWLLASLLWEAGVPRDVLQFLPCPDDGTGRALITSARVRGVILTGAWDTARLFLQWKPHLALFAETSGKNALLISACADPDLALRDLVHSAFGHSGQKCSAASLAIVEQSLYDSPSFRRQLRDAASSLHVGSAWDFASVVTPLIREPGPALLRGLTELDDGEDWLLEPKRAPDNPQLWSPGIRLHVRPGSWFHRTECFGPVLGLIPARDLEDALRIQNDSTFGLTGGLHSLDEREIAAWKDRVQVGNAYVNRTITGAVVRRQPFGGWKRSCAGPGAKAGGPGYLHQLARWRSARQPVNRQTVDPLLRPLLDRLRQAFPAHAGALKNAARNDAWWWEACFSQEHDPDNLFCETNIFRYRPFARAILRAAPDTPDTDLARCLLASLRCGVPPEISSSGSRDALREALGSAVDCRDESEEELSQRLLAAGSGANSWVIRAPNPGPGLRLAAFDAAARLASAPAGWHARIELPHYLREQAVSETKHRYGNPIALPPGRHAWKAAGRSFQA
ncbi:MAG TPA: bifunctional proline dehydrogenase/L-glutamate gamma-semialdehyde dehydrogenase [Verrucomicrobiales bacterium]|nr:bifunctional proline dehydrogenase/L-glutamate gamma-semialdehyde dehydrogenase [Verrucomicrobiales bacterium]